MTWAMNPRKNYFDGLNGVLTATRIDDLPDVDPAFASIAKAADTAMIEILAADLEFAARQAA